jgi:uncharacterized repeat protein (TIGR03803 family)
MKTPRGPAALIIGWLSLAATLPAQTFNVFYNFTGGTDGGVPLAGLIMDTAGNLFGTTSAGGSAGAGTVFKLNASGQEQVLYTFSGGADGANPQSSLLLDSSGNLFGTTYAGGAHGYGTVFELPASGPQKVLHSFAGGSDGANPIAGLIMNTQGVLYGTTFYGGAYSGGTIFEVSKAGKEAVIYSFGQGTDGANPVAALAFGPGGNSTLYGTTSAGGTAAAGTVFELASSKSGWKESILYNFQLQDDGGVPYAGVIFDKSGHLYGAATTGGAGGSNGGGTVFEMTHSSSGWNFAVINFLAGWGFSGTFRNLMLNAEGHIYATTHCDGDSSLGTIYELTRAGGAWTYTSLFEFPGSGADGYYVFSNLVADSQGNLYGSASGGGAYGSGVVFKITL